MTPAPPPPPSSRPTPLATPAGDGLIPAGDRLMLIVAGSSIAAEVRDRPLAYRLRERVLAWLDARQASDAANPPAALLQPVVCSDLWYLNDRALDERPVIAIGDPASNAATAMLSARLPTAFLIEQSFRVHLDPEFLELRAAIWGVGAAATASGIDLFVERYLNDFLLAAMDI